MSNPYCRSPESKPSVGPFPVELFFWWKVSRHREVASIYSATVLVEECISEVVHVTCQLLRLCIQLLSWWKLYFRGGLLGQEVTKLKGGRGALHCLNLHICEEERPWVASEGDKFGIKINNGLQISPAGLGGRALGVENGYLV